MQRLEELCELAEEQLTAALQQEDLEIRHRASRLLLLLAQHKALEEKKAAFARLKAFITDENGSRNTSLPGFEPYRQIVGNDAPARAFFLRMYHAEGELLDSYEKDPTAAAQTIGNRARARGPHRLSLESFVAYLLVALDDKATFSKEAVQLIHQNVHQRREQLRENEGIWEHWTRNAGGPERKVFLKWIRTPIYDLRLGSVLETVSGGNILPLEGRRREIVEFAALVLGSPLLREDDDFVKATLRIKALQVLALHGREVFGINPNLGRVFPNRALDLQETKSYLKLVERYLDDKTAGPGGAQVRDAAILALQSLSTCPRLAGSGRYRHDYFFLGQLPAASFDSSEAREAAIEKWRAWAGENLR